MPDYKTMYYHLAGRIAGAVEVLETTTAALHGLRENLIKAQLATEEMFINSGGGGDEEGERSDG
ncbi:MAG: hypothetical protein FWH06_02870 [Oscillospiraceae bacterium]|nr:hypothetical protein [Oscillospiraceae bacterium]